MGAGVYVYIWAYVCVARQAEDKASGDNEAAGT